MAKERRRQRKPFGKGFLWTLSQTEGPRPLRLPGDAWQVQRRSLQPRVGGDAERSRSRRRSVTDAACPLRVHIAPAEKYPKYGNLRRIRWCPRADRGVRPYEMVRFPKRADVLNRPLRSCAKPLKLPLHLPRGGACRAKRFARRSGLSHLLLGTWIVRKCFKPVQPKTKNESAYVTVSTLYFSLYF